MTYGTIFSGIGGWELGLNAAGWDLKWQCECEAYPRAALKERFCAPCCPDVGGLAQWHKRNLADCQVDAIIGSPPCQPFSLAGEQRGESDPRHLYPAFIRAVRKLRPRIVLMEQVPAILGNGGGIAFGGYVGGLVGLGYDCLWHRIPAAAVGAPIERDRLWIVAVSNQVNGAPRMGAVANRKKTRLEFRPGERIPFWIQATSQFARVGNGFSDQLYRDRTEALGNAVVPQIAELIGQAINEVNL